LKQVTPEEQRIFFYRMLGNGSHVMGLAVAYMLYKTFDLNIVVSIVVFILVTIGTRLLSNWLIQNELS